MGTPCYICNCLKPNMIKYKSTKQKKLEPIKVCMLNEILQHKKFVLCRECVTAVHNCANTILWMQSRFNSRVGLEVKQDKKLCLICRIPNTLNFYIFPEDSSIQIVFYRLIGVTAISFAYICISCVEVVNDMKKLYDLAYKTELKMLENELKGMTVASESSKFEDQTTDQILQSDNQSIVPINTAASSTSNESDYGLWIFDVDINNQKADNLTDDNIEKGVELIQDTNTKVGDDSDEKFKNDACSDNLKDCDYKEWKSAQSKYTQKDFDVWFFKVTHQMKSLEDGKTNNDETLGKMDKDYKDNDSQIFTSKVKKVKKGFFSRKDAKKKMSSKKSF